MCIGVRRTETCVLTQHVVERNVLSASCDVLAHRCGDMNTNFTDRKEVNKECKK